MSRPGQLQFLRQWRLIRDSVLEPVSAPVGRQVAFCCLALKRFVGIDCFFVPRTRLQFHNRIRANQPRDGLQRLVGLQPMIQHHPCREPNERLRIISTSPYNRQTRPEFLRSGPLALQSRPFSCKRVAIESRQLYQPD